MSTMTDNLRRLRHKARVCAVYEQDLHTLLSQLGLLDRIESGAESCANCGSPITLSNIAAWRLESSGLLFLCDRAVCLWSLSPTPRGEDHA